MAERLLVTALRSHVGDRVDELYRSHGAGTGTWHVGEAMNPPAAAEVRRRGGDPARFVARHLTADLIDESDLVLCATGEQVDRVLRLRPQARARTFVLGEFGRLLGGYRTAAPHATLPVAPHDVRAGGAPRDPATAHMRGVALVAAVEAVRAGVAARAEDDLDDPWGMGQREFARVADEIEATVVPLAAALVGASHHDLGVETVR